MCWTPLIYAIPLALNTEAILHSNNTRDVDIDREAGIVTLAILAGRTCSYVIFVVLLFLPYVAFVVLVAYVSLWFAIPLATVLLTFDIERQFRRDELSNMPKRVGRLNLLLSLTYVISCAFANRNLLPGLT